MASHTVVDSVRGKRLTIDFDNESGRLWMDAAGADVRLKKARHAYTFTRKEYGAKDPRTIQYKAAFEAAKIAAENAERAWTAYVEAL